MGKLKLSQAYFPTLREAVRDEDSVSGNLLVRAGYIKKVGAGIYTLLPLGHRICQKIENIVREEMDAIGSQELVMPVLIPSEVYAASGRLENFGPSIFQLHDRYGKDYVLGPTHEELFTEACKQAVNSYKDLPLSLYQIQTKFRDEPRPRFGLIRVRQFVMKDSYTFARDLEGLDVQYKEMFEAYKRIFDRVGLHYAIVRADTGVMGGLLSEEFQAICSIGEDIVVYEPQSAYASNLEVAECLAETDNLPVCTLPGDDFTLLSTPDGHTIDELQERYSILPTSIVKSLIYAYNSAEIEQTKYVAVLVRGDRAVNETKLQKLLHAVNLNLADEEKVKELTGANVGSVGPFDLNLPLVVDQEAACLDDFVVGANQDGHHLIHCHWTKIVDLQKALTELQTEMALADFRHLNLEQKQTLQASLPYVSGRVTIADVRNIAAGDTCVNGKGKVEFKHGIEVGNTFKLGSKYAKALNLTYVDENNQRQYVEMGCYGIGIGRTLAAMVEQQHTEKGLLWPKHLAPIQVAIVVVNNTNTEQMQVAEKIYDSLDARRYDIVLDDRKERVGVKFNDMELVGAYCRITVGRSIADGLVEVKLNGTDVPSDLQDVQMVKITEVSDFVSRILG